MRNILILSSTLASVFATPVGEFVEEAMKSNLLLKEKQFEAKVTKHEIDKYNKEALLPRLRLTTAFGPAPGLYKGLDTVTVDDTQVIKTVDHFDFTQIGSYFATKIELQQPLNFSWLNLGNQAMVSQHKLKLAEISSYEAKTSREMQELYYGYQVANSSYHLVKKVHGQLESAIEDTEEKLEDDEPGVSQFDLLEMQTAMFEVENGLYEAQEGLEKAKANFAFLFPEKTPQSLFGPDSSIRKRKEALPSWEDCKQLLLAHNPDLKQVDHGLSALRANAEIKESSIGPTFFFFGQLEFSKSWARERIKQESSVFSPDPLNKFEGALGIGAQFDLNIWKKNHEAKKAELEVRKLEVTKSYAKEGLLLKAKEAYEKTLRYKRKVASAKRGLEATGAWVQARAMQFDLDPSKSKDLIKALEKDVSMKKNLYLSLYDYNLAFAKLVESLGLTLSQYHELTKGP